MTEITKQAKKIFDTYLKAMKDSESKLSDLEKQSQELQTVLEDREATKAEIRASERGIASLESEREGLKGDHAEALFEGDTAAQQQIVRRRNAIDRELAEARKEIERLRAILDASPVDSKEVAKLAAEIDSWSEPSALGMVNKLRDLLVRNSELPSRHHDLKNMVPEVDEQIYHELRLEQDGTYAASHRATEKEAAAFKRREEHAKNFRNPFDSPPSVDPRVSTKYVGD